MWCCGPTSFLSRIECRDEESSWRHYLGYLRATTLGPITWLWLLSFILRRKCTGKGYSEQTTFLYYFRGCFIIYWAYGLPYWAPPWAPPSLSRAFHSRQMDTIGMLCSPYSRATTGWGGIAGWAFHRVSTTCPYTTYAWGPIYYSTTYPCNAYHNAST